MFLCMKKTRLTRSTCFVNVNSFEDFIEPNLFLMFFNFLILSKTKNIFLIAISDCHYQANKYILSDKLDKTKRIKKM